jgi:hypothetical protein
MHRMDSTSLHTSLLSSSSNASAPLSSDYSESDGSHLPIAPVGVGVVAPHTLLVTSILYDTVEGNAPPIPPVPSVSEYTISDNLLLPGTYIVYGQRWWVLFCFVLLAINQGVIWIGFAPIIHEAKEYYNTSTSQIDLLLNWVSSTSSELCTAVSGVHRQLNQCTCVCLCVLLSGFDTFPFICSVCI